MSIKMPGVMIYRELLPAVNRLDLKQRGELFTAILGFAEDGREPCFEDALLGVVWEFVAIRLRADVERYKSRCAKSRESARQRWDANACEGIPEDANACNNNTNTNSKINNNNSTINNSNRIGHLREAKPVENSVQNSDNVQNPEKKPSQAPESREGGELPDYRTMTLSEINKLPDKQRLEVIYRKLRDERGGDSPGLPARQSGSKRGRQTSGP